ncbi:MAG: stress response translation initiation inhibitor YciH [Planctomycetota bacterium]|nr:MAG: stress response translation initiation inhibitor YciH [Planctomycetota bacterium]
MAGRMHHESGDLIWSPDGGGRCPDCGLAFARCTCRKQGVQGGGPGRGKRRGGKAQAARDQAPADGVVRVSRQSKGRKGKGVTLVTGLPLDAAGLAALAKQLKQRCGTGGTAKHGVIEIQGDQRDTLVAELEARGYQVKQAGG